MRVLTLLVALAIFAVVGALASRQYYESFPAEAYGTVPMGSSSQSYMYYELAGDPSKTAAQRAELPLLIFASGGPGSAGAFPNYLEAVGNHQLIFDPTNSSKYEIIPSKYAWTSFANVIFPDSPLGTGWSNAGSYDDFSTTDEGIADNLVLLMKGFLKNHPEFKGSEFTIVGESYSGKIAMFFGVALLASGIDLKLKAVSSNDGWNSGIDCMKTYGAFMRANSLCNEAQATEFDEIATAAAEQLAAGAGANATNIWGNQQSAYDEAANGVNVYNIDHYYTYFPESFLGEFMNGPYRAKIPSGVLPSSKTFNDQDGQVFTRMSNAFMKEGISPVQQLINAGISVHVWSGQKDLIVNTLCTRAWIDQLPWKSLSKYQSAARYPFVLNTTTPDRFNNGFLQKYENFFFWSVTDAGHMAPLDQGETAHYIAKYIVNGGSDKTPFARAAELSNKKNSKNKKYRRL